MSHRTETIQLHIRALVLPKNHQEFIQVGRLLVKDGQLEKGCRSYEIYQDLDADNCYHLVAEWSTRADLEIHISKQNFGALFGALNFLGTSYDITIHQMSYEGGKDLISQMRNQVY